MLLFSQTAEYALRAAVHLAQRMGETQTNQQIADATKVPAGYLSKVLQALAKAGLVRAQRGLRGGFVLARPAEEISALDVVNAVDPLTRIRCCPLELEEHGTNLCPLHRKIDDATAAVEQTLAQNSLADILMSPSASRPLGNGRSSE